MNRKKAEEIFPANAKTAGQLDQIAHLLAAQGANPFRIRAYRKAAGTVRGLREPVDSLVERGGSEALRGIPGIGAGLAGAIVTSVTTGHLPILDRLRGKSDPESVLMTLPGIGRTLAKRLCEELDVHSLEELEIAVHSGRLAAMSGIGKKRVEGIKSALQARLGRKTADPSTRIPVPSVKVLLGIDAEYRRRAKEGALPRIAPSRFNPTGEAWLPVLHRTVKGRHFTAFFSNSELAHRLHSTHDWVIITEGDHGVARPLTVVTEIRGPLEGKRVVRSREAECLRFYSEKPRERLQSGPARSRTRSRPGAEP